MRTSDLPGNAEWRESVRQNRSWEIAGYARSCGLSVAEYEAQVKQHLRILLSQAGSFRRDLNIPVLNRILSEGFFQNAFETNRSGGLLTPAGPADLMARRRTEASHFGLPFDTPAGQRPIYGYFHSELSGRFADMGDEALEQYGALFTVRFKPSLKEAATSTVGDSLDETGQGTLPHIAALPVSNPGWEAVTGSIGDVLKYSDLEALSRRVYDAEHPYPVYFIEAQYHERLTTDYIEEIIFYEIEPPEMTRGLLEQRSIIWRVIE